MTTAGLFKVFGGRDTVMAITGCSRQAVNHWHEAGVPYRHWPALVKAAVAAGHRGVTNEALADTRPTTPRRRAA